MNMEHLRYFLVLAEYENYTKAAQMLNIAQPSLNYAISGLEKELKAELFQKQGRNVTLTNAGKIYLRYAKNALESLDAGRNRVIQLMEKSENIIRATYSNIITYYFQPSILNLLISTSKATNIPLRFHPEFSTDIFTHLSRGYIDIAIFPKLTKEQPGVAQIPLVNIKFVAITPLDHPLSAKTSVTLEDCARYDFLCYSKSQKFYADIRDQFHNAGLFPLEVNYALDSLSLMLMVESGLGISIVPYFPILDTMKLCCLPVSDLDFGSVGLFNPETICLAYKTDPRINPNVMTFVEHIRQHNNIQLNMD